MIIESTNFPKGQTFREVYLTGLTGTEGSLNRFNGWFSVLRLQDDYIADRTTRVYLIDHLIQQRPCPFRNIFVGGLDEHLRKII